MTVAAVLLPWVGLSVTAVRGGDDEIVTLACNEVVQTASGGRIWRGGMLNTGDEYYDVEVRIRFLDQDNNTVGETSARTDVLGTGKMLPLEAPLPASAARVQMYSLHWRAGKNFSVGRLFGVSALGVRLPAVPGRQARLNRELIDPGKPWQNGRTNRSTVSFATRAYRWSGFVIEATPSH